MSRILITTQPIPGHINPVLPIARKLANAMGGDLWYEDRFPVGAKFRFTIPISSFRSDALGPQVPQHAVR